MAALLAHAAGRGSKLEGPHAVRHGAKVLPAGVDLVHHILGTHDVLIVELVLDQLVVANLHALAVDLEVATLVHHRADSGEGGVPVRNVGLHRTQHVLDRLVQLHEDGVEDLAQAQQLQDFALLRVHLRDTADAGHNGDLGLRLEVVVPLSGSLATETHQLLLLVAVGAGVLQATLIRELLEGVLGSLVRSNRVLERSGLLLLKRSALDSGLRGRDSGH